MNKTPNLQLNVPAKTEFYNVEDFNENFNKLDEEVSNRVEKQAGKMLSSNDYTNGDKEKLDSLSALTVLTDTLVSGATSLSLKNPKITTNSVIDIYASVYGIVPVDVSVLTGEIRLKFEAQSSPVDIRVEVR